MNCTVVYNTLNFLTLRMLKNEQSNVRRNAVRRKMVRISGTAHALVTLEITDNTEMWKATAILLIAPVGLPLISRAARRFEGPVLQVSSILKAAGHLELSILPQMS